MENGSRYPSQQTKAAISAKMKGRTFTQQHKDNISAALKKWYSNDANFPNDNIRHEGSGKGYIESGDVV